MKKLIILLIAGLLAGGVYGCSGGSDDKSESETSTQAEPDSGADSESQTEAETDTVEEEPTVSTAPPETIEIGLGGVKTKGQKVIVTLDVANGSDEDVDLWSTEVNLTGGDGEIYRVFSDVEAASDTLFVSETIEANSDEEVKVVFKVPPAAQAGSTVKISDVGGPGAPPVRGGPVELDLGL